MVACSWGVWANFKASAKDERSTIWWTRYFLDSHKSKTLERMYTVSSKRSKTSALCNCAQGIKTDPVRFKGKN